MNSCDFLMGLFFHPKKTSVFLALVIPFAAFGTTPAAAVPSARTTTSLKYPDPKTERGEPISTIAEVPQLIRRQQGNTQSFTELLDYILPAPNQQDAGSCLYMALTGMAEWWYAKLAGHVHPASESTDDFSERFLMNINEDASLIGNGNPLTDTIFSYNKVQSQTLLNRDYPFTMGWIKDSPKGYSHTAETDPEASYSTAVNWINDLTSVSAAKVSLPFFSRQIIFTEAHQDRWAVDVAPSGIVDQVKFLLKQNHAPVTIIYNHYLYWHAVNIVGYSDDEPTNGCKFTMGFAASTRKKAQAVQATDPQRAQRWNSYADSVEKNMTAEGGCAAQGVFYVRDSLYPDESAPFYDYDKNHQGEEEKYTLKVIQREYQWLKRFSNHAYQILAQP